MRGMSSRTDSLFGTLGSRVEATRAGGGAGSARVVRALGRGRWVEFHADDGWTPGLQLTWERDPGGAWWGRVVVVDDQGVAVELLSSAARLRPAGAGLVPGEPVA